MMHPSILRIALAALLLTASAHFAAAQSMADYKEFHRLMLVDALERIRPSYPAESPESEPFVIGVLRDSLGRPVQLTRFRFGNLDNRSDWATMRIEFRVYDSLNVEVERRSYYNASGMPAQIDWASYEEIYRRKNGLLIQRKLVDRAGKAVNDSAGVHRALYRSEVPGTFVQEWYYSSGKLHYGTGSDGPFRPFAPMPKGTYYRRFSVDAQGNLTREEVWGLNKRHMAFPGGEVVRTYELNEYGQPVATTFFTADGSPMTDTNGVARIAYSYDGWGRMIEWRAFDERGKPKGRAADGVAGMRFIFRAFDGILVREEKLDDDGDVME